MSKFGTLAMGARARSRDLSMDGARHTYLTAAEAYGYDAEIVPVGQEFGLYLRCGSHFVLWVGVRKKFVLSCGRE